MFTQSTVVGAPVALSRERVRRGVVRAIVANSGCSNVAMGARGMRDARAMTALAARSVGCKPDEVLVASTGVIGHPLPMEKIEAGILAAGRALRPEGLSKAARAILTTDLTPKCASLRTRIDGRTVTLAGIAKGSGMIEPNMATMLSFLLTDAAVAPPLLRKLLRAAADESYNRVTVDGETSTSDTVFLLANGRAGNSLLRDAASAGARHFAGALGEVTQELARAIARDGEGATKLVTVRVSGARRADDALRAARRIANSTAGEDRAVRGRPQLGTHPADGRRRARRDRSRARRSAARRSRGIPQRFAHGRCRAAACGPRSRAQGGRCRTRSGRRPPRGHGLDLRSLL